MPGLSGSQRKLGLYGSGSKDYGGHTSTFVSPGVSTGNSVVVVIVAVVVCAVVAAAYGMQWSEQTTTITTMVKCTVLLHWCYCTGTAGAPS